MAILKPVNVWARSWLILMTGGKIYVGMEANEGHLKGLRKRVYGRGGGRPLRLLLHRMAPVVRLVDGPGRWLAG